MTGTERLDLHHEVMLLSLRADEGTPEFGVSSCHALAGAILAELLLRERIGIQSERNKQFVRVQDASPAGEPILDEALEKMVSVKRRATLQTWVSRLATQKLRTATATELCRRGILRADEASVLLIFKRKIYPELDPRPEREVVDRLKTAISGEATDLEPRTAILVSLAKGTGLLKPLFSRQELKSREERIERIAKGEVTGKATAEAIHAAQAAIFVAAIIPSIVITTTAGH